MLRVPRSQSGVKIYLQHKLVPDNARQYVLMAGPCQSTAAAQTHPAATVLAPSVHCVRHPQEDDKGSHCCVKTRKNVHGNCCRMEGAEPHRLREWRLVRRGRNGFGGGFGATGVRLLDAARSPSSARARVWQPHVDMGRPRAKGSEKGGDILSVLGEY